MAANITDRQCLAADQIAQIWHRWQAGELISRIAEALDRPYMTVHSQIQRRGDCVPYVRRRSTRVLSLLEREEISPD
jgi:hypothetical protein